MNSYKAQVLFAVILISATIKAQKPVIVPLDRHVYPIQSYTRRYQKTFENDSIPGENGNYRQIDNYLVFAGDYSDDKAKFSLAINSFQIQADKDGTIYSQALETKQGNYEVYIAPYKADSIYIFPCNREEAQVTPTKEFYVSVADKEYACVLSSDIKKVIIAPYNGKWVKPKFRLYDDRLPNDTFQVVTGEKACFTQYEKKNKFIYVMVWTPDAMTGQLNRLQEISEKYKNKLTNIIFIDDIESYKKFDVFKGNDWIVSTLSFFSGCDFQFNFSPNGVLFDADGHIVNRGILPSELDAYMKKFLKTE